MHKNPVRSNMTLISKESDELGMEAHAALSYIAEFAERAERSRAEIDRLIVSIRRRVALELVQSETAFDGEPKAA